MSKIRFISFEGIDFSGKTTQIRLLTERLKKYKQKVTVIREPGGTLLSEHIRTILLNKKYTEMTSLCELFLYSAARHQLIREKIIPALSAGNFVIADRYVDSTTAYQGFGREISKKLVNEVNHQVTKDCMPALTFYLDLKPEEFMKRIRHQDKTADRLESSGEKFYYQVYEGYHKIVDKNKNRIKRINASQSIEQIESQVWNLIQEFYGF
jgi:dTMP kinase